MGSKWAEMPKEAEDHLGKMAEASNGDAQDGRARLTVHFVQKSGDAESFSYAHLYKLLLKGNERIEMTFSDHTVVIEGRGLADLYRKLGDHRKARVVVKDRAEFADGEVVESIKVTKRAG